MTKFLKVKSEFQFRWSGFKDIALFNLAYKERVYFDHFTDSVTVLDFTFIFVLSTFLE